MRPGVEAALARTRKTTTTRTREKRPQDPGPDSSVLWRRAEETSSPHSRHCAATRSLASIHLSCSLDPLTPSLLRPWGELAARFPCTRPRPAMTGGSPRWPVSPVRPPLRAAADAGTRRPGRSPRSAEGMPSLLGRRCGRQAARTPASPSALSRAAAQQDIGRNRTRSCRSGPPVRHGDSSTAWVSRSPKAEARAASSPLAPRREQAQVRPASPSQKDGPAARADGPAAAGRAPGRPVRPSSLPATSVCWGSQAAPSAAGRERPTRGADGEACRARAGPAPLAGRGRGCGHYFRASP